MRLRTGDVYLRRYGRRLRATRCMEVHSDAGFLALIWHNEGMERLASSPGADNSALNDAHPSRPDIPVYVINSPLPPSRIAWLRQQSIKVAVAAKMRLGR